MPYKFKQVDVFTDRAGYGNALAVVLGGDELDTEAMQRLANWTNLSETTFILKPTTPEAAYRLRIFTPRSELPFAGHPSVGSAHAALEAGLVNGPEFSMECGAGILPLSVMDTRNGPRVSVAAPDARLERECADLLATIGEALGAQPESDPAPATLRNGPVWLFTQLDTATLSELKPDMAAVVRLSQAHGLTGIAAYALREGDGPRAHLRCFAPASGVDEDPVTGSANAALPAFLAHRGLLDRLGSDYVATQGTELGRDGRVYVRVLDDQGRATIGGHSVTVIDGEIRLP